MKIILTLAAAAFALTGCGATLTGSFTTKDGATFSAGVKVPVKPAK